MTILHVADFHFNQRWFEWLRHSAPSHHLLVMSGDLLDQTSAVPRRTQVEWLSAWFADYTGAACVCSGAHDMEWDRETERWRPAYWLREIASDTVWTDGQLAVFDGQIVANIGSATWPKGRAADLWVVHAPPAGTAVARRASGRDGGDLDLAAALKEHAPRIVFSGQVHEPRNWFDRIGESLVLNPGRDERAPFPNHIVVETDPLTCVHVSSALGVRRLEAPAIEAEAETAMAAAAVVA